MNQMTKRTRIKMCGMTRNEDVVSASQLGADAIGFVFYPPSPRAVDIHQASALVEHCLPLVSKVALFVNPDVQYVNDVIQAIGADILQFHGDEDEGFCRQFKKPYIKALRVSSAEDINEKVSKYPSANIILLDAYVKGIPGGTGQTFDWSLIPAGISHKLMLAGGLSAVNVKQAIIGSIPYAVDVSGGIEESPGVKSISKMSAFVTAVHSADQALNEISS